MWVSKKQKTWAITLISLMLMIATVPAAIWLTHTQTAELGNQRARCEKGAHGAHQMFIQNGQVTPEHVDAKLCDRLTLVNMDSQDRLMAFGKHDQHISYDGVSERNLGTNQRLSVNLVRSGNFMFHDHLDDDVRGTFSVR